MQTSNELKPRTGTLVILTGTSRGLGHGLAVNYLAHGARVLGLSRSVAGDLALNPDFEQWPVDLGSPLPVAERLTAWLEEIGRLGAPTRVRLIHNAASLTPPGPISDEGSGVMSGIAQSLRVGLEAPLVLTAAFLRATASWNASDRRVLFVSSGLGRRAMAGCAPYCAQKAGLDHLARALALEEAVRPNGVRVASVAPGIIDTDMQHLLRGADPALFPERGRFEEWHRVGALESPEQAAARLIARLERADFGDEPVADVREG